MRILRIPQETTWSEFQANYLGFFPISNATKRTEAMAKEYTRLTGNPAEDLPDNLIESFSQGKFIRKRRGRTSRSGI